MAMRGARWAVLTGLVMAQAAPVSAATHCVADAQALRNSLVTAAANGEADDIRVVAGSHLLSSTLFFSTHEAFALSLSGRWNAACTAQDGGTTMLDGQNLTRILYVNSDAASDLVLTDLYFTRASDRALLIETSGLNVLVERNLFVGNRSTSDGAGARIAVSTANSVLVVRNNIVFGNTAREGAGLVVNAGIGVARINGNTVVANTSTIAGALCGGLCIAGGSDFTLSNNILWGNGGADLHNATTALTRLFCNDTGSLSGTLPDIGGSGNLSIAPGFAPGLLNFRLDPGSPLVNAGCTAFGGAGELDVARDPRRQGRALDIGAYESDVILSAGFDPAALP